MQVDPRRRRAAVEGVSEDWKATVGRVDPDLMGAPGQRLCFDRSPRTAPGTVRTIEREIGGRGRQGTEMGLGNVGTDSHWAANVFVTGPDEAVRDGKGRRPGLPVCQEQVLLAH